MYLDIEIDLSNKENLSNKLLSISNLHSSFCSLDSNNYTHDRYSKYKKLIAIGSIEEFCLNNDKGQNKFNLIEKFINKYSNSWKFVYLSYKLKNYFEKLSSSNIDKLNFNDAYLFIPKFVFIETKNSVKLQHHKLVSREEVIRFINSLHTEPSPHQPTKETETTLKPRIDKEEYLNKISKIKEDIKLGDIYEMNFCQEFYNHTPDFDTITTYKTLNKYSPAPFSAYFKENSRYLISSSPERYLLKHRNTVISQPIKGTARRSTNKDIDNKIKEELRNNTKERAENIMIVDLVRNDLSRIPQCKKVEVTELCKIYSFPHVHQMISSVKAELDSSTKFIDIIKNSFPMGSMTGAPKIRAMELIEEYESHERGLFSGSVGYIAPNGDFDLNVIIRSLLYNKDTKYLSLSAGGAITYKSDAKSEYEESLLKAKAILDLL